MSESRAEEVDRISCEEEERVSSGYEVSTYFAVDGGNLDSVRKATACSSETRLLNLRYIAAARLYHVNSQWRSQRAEGFPLGLTSGDWRTSMPGPNDNVREEFRLVKLLTSNLADALYIEPIAALGLKPEGVITLEHALKRAIETVFQVEPNEIGVVTLGDPEAPNILLYEAAEGSLGILSQFVDDTQIFHKVIEAAKQICRFDDPEYHAPASYDDLLSYYNQRDHKVIDRHLIKDALEKLRICSIEIQTNTGFGSYEDQYQAMLRHLDPNSSTERTFINFLYENGLRLPDAAQKRVEGLYCQPDFYYEPRFWVFCDGSPHDDEAVKKRDEEQRQLIIARGDEVWVWHYRDQPRRQNRPAPGHLQESAMTTLLQPGKLVSLRGREWIVLPSEDNDLLIVKPLGGSDDEIAGIYLPLGIESDQPADARFEEPTAADLGDISTARLLYDSARLAFRNGAGPFRALAKLSFRPRAYQMVPLIMALRQESVRLLIADDVGVGKTVEALLIVRELLERRKIKRFAVVCLPHLCEQWQEEIRSKLDIEAVIIRSNTQARLDRQIQGDASVYDYYPYPGHQHRLHQVRRSPRRVRRAVPRTRDRRRDPHLRAADGRLRRSSSSATTWSAALPPNPVST